jgi:hypothetical protein
LVSFNHYLLTIQSHNINNYIWVCMLTLKNIGFRKLTMTLQHSYMIRVWISFIFAEITVIGSQLQWGTPPTSARWNWLTGKWCVNTSNSSRATLSVSNLRPIWPLLAKDAT